MVPQSSHWCGYDCLSIPTHCLYIFIMIGSVYVRNVGEIIFCRHIPTISHLFSLSSRSGLRAEIVNRIYDEIHSIMFRFIVFYATSNSISVISWLSFFFIGGGNMSIRRKPPSCRKSLTNFITYI